MKGVSVGNFSAMAKILFLEDDSLVADNAVLSLGADGHTIEWVTEGKEALFRLRTYKYDVAILDWMVSDISGVEVCQEYRKQGGQIPVLMLTGKRKVSELVQGLDSGADDYLTKPFALSELCARVRALLRRPPAHEPDTVVAGDVVLDLAHNCATKNGQALELWPKELALLTFLMRHKGVVFGVNDLLERLWSSESDSSIDAVRQTVTRLRKKIDDPDGRSILVNVRGLGYKLDDTPE
jgi:DNA-binding response OmpR family regulator